MAVTTKILFPATSNSTTTDFILSGLQLNNQDDLDVYVTKTTAGIAANNNKRILHFRQNTSSNVDANHKQVNDTTGLYFPAITHTGGTETLENYELIDNNGKVRFNTALPEGAIVFVERRTRDADGNYTTFSSGSTIRATDLNNSATESNFTAQEARNKAFDLENKLFGTTSDGSIKTKLDGIEPNATQDQTASEIRDLIATSPLDANHITTNAVYTNAIQDDAVTADKLANSINSEIAANTAKITNQTHTGDVTGSVELTIADNAVTTAKIANNDVDDDKLSHTGVTSGSYGGSTAIPTIVVNEQGRVTSASENSVSFDVVADTSPSLGGDLDVEDKKIKTTTTNGAINIEPNGTGFVGIRGTGTQTGTISFATEDNNKGVKIKSPTSGNLTSSYELTLPVNNGDAGQFLKTDGSGVLSWDTVSGGGGGGGSATGAPNNIVTLTESIDGSRTDFSMSETPSSAQNLLVSVNGVIQKPNAGTTIASSAEGFCVSGSTLKFATAPASGSSIFIVEQSAVAAGSSSDKITEGNSEVEVYDDNATSRFVVNLDGNEKFRVNNDGQIGLGGTDYGTDGQVLTSQGSGAAAQWESIPAVNTDLVNDTSPQLGGDLDVQARKITTSTTNGYITLEPNGTGIVMVRGAGGNDGKIQLNCSQNSHGVSIQSPPHSANANYTLTLPTTDGNANQVLKTDGSGVLAWVDQPTDAGTLDGIDSSSFLRSDATDIKTAGHLTFNNNIKAKFGTSEYLEIYNEGTASHIKHTLDGQYLNIWTNDLWIGNGSGQETYILANHDDGVDLYFDNSVKFQTTANGCAIGDKLVVGSTSHPAINANADDLVIGNGTDYSGITVYSGTSHDGNIFFADGTSGAAQYRGFLQYQHNTNRMYFGTGGSTVVTFDENGLIGMGTTTPSSWNGDANRLVLYESGVNTGMTIATTGNNNCNIFFADSDTDGSAEYAGYIQYSHAQDELRLGANAGDRVRITDGNVTLVGADLIMSSGNGISFAATSDAAGRSSELLDDYEEGSWTPTVDQGTLSHVSAQYTKIGRLVMFAARIYSFSNTTSSSELAIGGLPYNVAGNADDVAAGIVMYSYVGQANNTVMYLGSNNKLYWYAGHSGAFDNIKHSDLTSNTDVYLQGQYQTT